MSLSSKTILLIEDDPNDTMLLERMFRSLSLSKPVQIVSEGEKAIAYLNGEGQFADREQHPLPTLIFLDLKLPGVSGFEVLTWIRQHPRLSKTRVVVLTGSKKSLDIYRAFELGANSYLVKPVRPEDLAALSQSLNLPWLVMAGQPLSETGSIERISREQRVAE
jgi:CheY-like chemotaxis protein